ncbi:MAG TPA: hypothetical protein VLS85_02860, partial [Hanamia sp.]|nr:hypothetical protein [Hanamia sp.]
MPDTNQDNTLNSYMQLQPLTAISPIDGRYRNQLQHLDEYFSEFALIKYRVKVEVEYFLFLSQKKFFKLTPQIKKKLLNIEKDFSIVDAEKIKATERITNHDVKAVEYFLKEILKEAGAEDLPLGRGRGCSAFRSISISPAIPTSRSASRCCWGCDCRRTFARRISRSIRVSSGSAGTSPFRPGSATISTFRSAV